MQIEKISCNSCGAPLDVPSAANYVTCNHCSTQLSVRRTSNVTYTEQLNRLTEKTDELSDRLEDLTTQNAVAALDREWEFERKKHMVSTKHGEQIPTEAGSFGGGVVIAIFGTLWTVIAFFMTQSAPDVGPFTIVKVVFPLFGVAFVVFGVMSSMASYDKAGKFRTAEARYKKKRNELLANK